MDVLSTTIHKARKDHACDYCGLNISIGEEYQNQTNVYDGELYHWKSHLSCVEIARKLKMFENCWYDEGVTAEHFQETVVDYLRGKNIVCAGWKDAIAKAKGILCEEATIARTALGKDVPDETKG